MTSGINAEFSCTFDAILLKIVHRSRYTCPYLPMLAVIDTSQECLCLGHDRELKMFSEGISSSAAYAGPAHIKCTSV